jgi:NMD protein affecting ribosome stability and mRNA decay
MCGKSDAEKQFYGELCLQCAKSKLEPLPSAKVFVCQKCGQVISKARVRKECSMEEEVARLLKIKAAHPVFAPDFSSVEYESEYGRISQGIVVLTEKSMCTVCGRAGTQYFEAIIQLRGEPKKVEKMGAYLEKRIKNRSFIPKIEELKEGIDLYCGSRNEAIAALNAYELGFLRTEKLAGERNGKRLYRTTLLVRF